MAVCSLGSAARADSTLVIPESEVCNWPSVSLTCLLISTPSTITFESAVGEGAGCCATCSLGLANRYQSSPASAASGMTQEIHAGTPAAASAAPVPQPAAR